MRLALIVVAVACATNSARAQGAKRPCTGTAPDSTLTAAAPLYRDCDVDTPAKQKGRPPRLSLSGTPAREGCIAAEFDIVVDTLGVPEPLILRAAPDNDRELADAVRASLFQLRFTPAMLGGRRVRQVVVYRQTAYVGRIVVRVGPMGGIPPTTSPRSPPNVPSCP